MAERFIFSQGGNTVCDDCRGSSSGRCWRHSQITWPAHGGYNPPTVTPVGGLHAWICPRCQSVYGPLVMECYRCNQTTAPRPRDG